MELKGPVVVDRKAILALAGLATALAYYAVAYLSVSARGLIPSITPLWPAAGLGLAAGLTFDSAASCPAVLVASAAVARTLGLPPLAVAAMAVANALEVFLASQILNRARLNGHSFYNPLDFALYSLITGLSCAAGSLVAVLSFRHAGMLGEVSLGLAILTRVLAHWAGMLMVTPLLLLWRHHPKLSLRPGPTLEGLAVAGATVGVCWLLFGPTRAATEHLPLSFLLPALAVWPAVRQGLRETATINMLIAGAALWGTVERRGPFASAPHEASITLLQGCLAAQAIVGMSLASAVWRAKDSTAEMESARKRLRLILDISPGYIAYLTPQRTFALVNEMFSGWFRAPSQALIGRSVREAAGAGWAVVEPLIERAFQGETVHDTVIQPDPRGRYHWMDMHYAPDTDERGAIRGVIMLAVDVTELKRKEQALRETEARLRLVLDNSPVFIGYVDSAGRYRMINQRFHDWFGKKAAAMVGMSTEEALGPEAWPAFEPLQRRALGGERVHQQLRASDAQGRTRWLDVTYVPDRDDRGTVRGFFISTVDVSALKETEERLRKAEQLLRGLNEDLERRVAQRTARLSQVNDELESFAYTVAHDLRSPLRKMSGFSEAVLHDYEGKLDPKGAGYLKLIFDSSRRMGRLIDEMLDLSMVTRAEVKDEPVDLSALAMGIVEELRHAEPDRQVETVIAPGLTARGDRGLLEAALRNLLDNAWKFTRPKGKARIEVGMTPQEGAPIFFVRDDGVGFDMALRGKLFTAFERLHAREAFPGSGIGLATVQRVVQRHGGRVWAEGEPGKGAAFYFTLHERNS